MTLVRTLIELDDLRGAYSGKVGRPEHTRYLVTEESDGTLVFTPEVVLDRLDSSLVANRALVGRIEVSRADPQRLVRRATRG